MSGCVVSAVAVVLTVFVLLLFFAFFQMWDCHENLLNTFRTIVFRVIFRKRGLSGIMGSL